MFKLFVQVVQRQQCHLTSFFPRISKTVQGVFVYKETSSCRFAIKLQSAAHCFPVMKKGTKWQRGISKRRESSTPRTQHPHRVNWPRTSSNSRFFSGTKNSTCPLFSSIVIWESEFEFRSEATISLVKPHNSSFLNGQKSCNRCIQKRHLWP